MSEEKHEYTILLSEREAYHLSTVLRWQKERARKYYCTFNISEDKIRASHFGERMAAIDAVLQSLTVGGDSAVNGNNERHIV